MINKNYTKLFILAFVLLGLFYSILIIRGSNTKVATAPASFFDELYSKHQKLSTGIGGLEIPPEEFADKLPIGTECEKMRQETFRTDWPVTAYRLPNQDYLFIIQCMAPYKFTQTYYDYLIFNREAGSVSSLELGETYAAFDFESDRAYLRLTTYDGGDYNCGAEKLFKIESGEAILIYAGNMWRHCLSDEERTENISVVDEILLDQYCEGLSNVKKYLGHPMIEGCASELYFKDMSFEDSYIAPISEYHYFEGSVKDKKIHLVYWPEEDYSMLGYENNFYFDGRLVFDNESNELLRVRTHSTSGGRLNGSVYNNDELIATYSNEDTDGNLCLRSDGVCAFWVDEEGGPYELKLFKTESFVVEDFLRK